MPGDAKLTGKHRKDAYKLLHLTAQLLTKHKIPYLLDAGTLLGVIREDRLLPWDDDVDLTIGGDFAGQLLAMRWKFWLKGYRTRVRRYKKDQGVFKKGQVRLVKIQTRKWFFLKDKNLLDIFVKYKVGEDYYWAVGRKPMVMKKVKAHYFDQTRLHCFDQALFSVPKDSEGYLAYHYGENWRTPVKTWNFIEDDSCEAEELK
jgi:lipopolysaccharide cholinephosphotransferase